MGDNYDHLIARMRGMKKGIPFTIYSVFGLTTSLDFNRAKFYVHEAHFLAKSIVASPVTIAYKTGELFMFFFIRLLNMNVL